MRLWTIHPRYLDTKGLVAVWREGLLAQKVLQDQTKGYRNHPQLRRFKSSSNALGAIATYLRSVCEEGARRGYRFDKEKINPAMFDGQIVCTRGQLYYEWEHLRRKLKQRDLSRLAEIEQIQQLEPHPLFQIVEGEVEDWEIRNESSSDQPFSISS